MKILVWAVCFAVGTACTTSAAHEARHYFYAACHHPSHGALGYSGPRYRDAAGAEKECTEHRRIYPRHLCTIQPITY